MKHILMLFLFFLPLLVLAQDVNDHIAQKVDSLIQHSKTLSDQRQYDQALAVNLEAEQLALEQLGPETAVYGNACFNHGRILQAKRDYEVAEGWYLKSLEIHEKASGKVDSGYAYSLYGLANLYQAQGLFQKALPLQQESKNIREELFGREHLDYLRSLNNLANLYTSTGQFEKSEAAQLEVISLWEKLKGKQSPDYCGGLINLGMLYRAIGLYEKSEELYLEAKDIFENRLQDRKHPYYTNCLNNLGNLYYSMQDYAKAEPIYLEVLQIKEELIGKDDPRYTLSLGNLGNLYFSMGNCEKAEPLYISVRAGWEKAFGKNNYYYATSLNNLAGLYLATGAYEKARPFYEESLALNAEALGNDHPDYADGLNNLAILYLNSGEYAEAEKLHFEALNIKENKLGKNHAKYAESLQNLANLYNKMQAYAKAGPLYQQALNIYEATLGKENPSYSKTLNGLALVEWEMGNYATARIHFEELAGLNQSLAILSQYYLSELELNAYLQKFSASQEQLFSFAETLAGQVPDLAADFAKVVYDNSLFYKGFLLNAAHQNKIRALADPLGREQLYQLKSIGFRLAGEYAKPIAERDSVMVGELEEKANVVEKELVRTVAGFGEGRRQVNWREVQSQLVAGEAAIEFVHYQRFDREVTDQGIYAALVLKPGADAPQFIPLTTEAELTKLMPESSNRPDEDINKLYAQRSIYQQLWQPLEQALKGVTTVYFSPAGQLHRLSLNAIRLNETEILADRYRLIRLGSTRQVLSLKTASQTKSINANALLFGGIRYEMDSVATMQANAQWSSGGGLGSRSALRGLSFADTDATLRNDKWNYLQWTEIEVDAIGILLEDAKVKTVIEKGYAASEEAFKAKASPAPRILHLATHGFFFPDPIVDKIGGQEPIFKTSGHPMIRSGLVLAGANYAWQTGKPLYDDMEDGILTAYEISHLDLTNTELVVLSACETGLGDIKGTEGVYGLQRAFKIAGAKNLIMSLWQVPEFQTQELMTDFYYNWLEEKMTIPKAFRTAQSAIRAKYPEPFYWAGFVLVQ